MKRDIVNELHHSVRKNFERRKVIMRGINELWQADLVEMIPYSSENKNFKYILMVIDCFSKFGYATCLLDKRGESITKAFRDIFTKFNQIPSKICTDFGKEFYCKPFRALMKEFKIHHYSTYSHLKVKSLFNYLIRANICLQKDLFFS